MAGVSLLTALEIFSNPNDLSFTLCKSEGKWGFAITRGHGHNCKPLITCEPHFSEKDAVVACVTGLLEQICTVVSREFGKRTSPVTQHLNPEDRPLDDADALSGAYRERIIADLVAKGIAQTHLYSKSVKV